MSDKDLIKAIDEVYEELNALSPEEIKKELDSHKDGDIANIILHTNTLLVGEIEASAHNDEYTNALGKLNLSDMHRKYEIWTTVNSTTIAEEILLNMDVDAIENSEEIEQYLWQFDMNSIGEWDANQMSFFHDSDSAFSMVNIQNDFVSFNEYVSKMSNENRTIKITSQNIQNSYCFCEECELEWAA